MKLDVSTSLEPRRAESLRMEIVSSRPAGRRPDPVWRRAALERGALTKPAAICRCGDCLSCELAAMRERTSLRRSRARNYDRRIAKEAQA